MKFHTQLKAKDIFKFSISIHVFRSTGDFDDFYAGSRSIYDRPRNRSARRTDEYYFWCSCYCIICVINPLMIYVKAKKQAIENPVYKNPTYYTLRDDGIFVELGEESATIEWNRVYKIDTVLWG